MGNTANAWNASSAAGTGPGLPAAPPQAPTARRGGPGPGTDPGALEAPRAAGLPQPHQEAFHRASRCGYVQGNRRRPEQALTGGRAVATRLNALSLSPPPSPPVKLSPSPPRWRLFPGRPRRPCGLRRRAERSPPPPPRRAAARRTLSPPPRPQGEPCRGTALFPAAPNQSESKRD